MRNERVESPVDLSVRTVRRSADSTAWRGPGPESVGSEPEDCDSTVTPRASPLAPPRAPRRTAVVPRMHFMPDFSVAHFHQQQQQRQQQQRRLHEMEEQQQQQVPLPGMSTLPWSRAALAALQSAQHSPLLPLFSSNRSSLYPSSSAPALPAHAADPTGYLGYLPPETSPGGAAGDAAGGAAVRIRTKAEMKMLGDAAAAEAPSTWVASPTLASKIDSEGTRSCEASTSGLSLSSCDEHHHQNHVIAQCSMQESSLKPGTLVPKAEATALVSVPASLSLLHDRSTICAPSPSTAEIETVSTLAIPNTDDIPSTMTAGLPQNLEEEESFESAWEKSCLDFEQQLEASEFKGSLNRRSHRKSNEKTCKTSDHTSIVADTGEDRTLSALTPLTPKSSKLRQNTSPDDLPTSSKATNVSPALSKRKARNERPNVRQDSDSSSGSDKKLEVGNRLRLSKKDQLKENFRTRSARQKERKLLNSVSSKRFQGENAGEKSTIRTRKRANGFLSKSKLDSTVKSRKTLSRQNSQKVDDNHMDELQKEEDTPSKEDTERVDAVQPAESDEDEEPNSTETKSVKIRLRTRVVEIEQAYSLRPKGDGSDFRPGWEEEVFQYKRSLRMPQVLLKMSKSIMNPEGECSKSSVCSTSESAQILQQPSRVNSEIDSASNYPDVESEDASSSVSNSLPAISRRGTPKLNIVDQLVEKVSQVSAIKTKNSSERIKDTSNGKVLKLARNTTGPSAKKPVTNFRDAFLQLKENKINTNDHKNTSDSLKAVFGTMHIPDLKGKGKVTDGKIKVKSKMPASKRKSESMPPRRISLRKRNLIIPKPNSRRASSRMSVDQSEGIVLRPRDAQTLLGSRSGMKSAALIRRSKVVLNSKQKKTRKLSSQILTKDNAVEEVEGQSEQTGSKDLAENVASTSAEVSTVAQPVVVRKRMKLRRKFRSGFDYIRKKKKVKKDDAQKITVPKVVPVVERIPMSEEQIQVAIRNWVINRSHGDTVLHRAARLGYAEVAEFAVKKLKISPRVTDNAGYTPLHEAARRGHVEISKILLEHGADVSCSAQGGVRPLHEAAESNQVEMLRLLLEYGADPTLATYSNQTPISIVEPDSEAHQLLTLYLADVQGLPAPPWNFQGPSKIFDKVTYKGDRALQSPPSVGSDVECDINVVSTEVTPPPLYTFHGEPPSQLWVLIQDLVKVLNVSSEEDLLKCLSDLPSPNEAATTRTREISVEEFLQRTKAVTFFASLSNLPIPGSTVKLMEYSCSVQSLLNEEVTTLNS